MNTGKVDVSYVIEAEVLKETKDLVPQLLELPQNEEERLIVQNAMMVLIKKWCILLSDLDEAVLSQEQARIVGLAFVNIVDMSLEYDEEE